MPYSWNIHNFHRSFTSQVFSPRPHHDNSKPSRNSVFWSQTLIFFYPRAVLLVRCSESFANRSEPVYRWPHKTFLEPVRFGAPGFLLFDHLNYGSKLIETSRLQVPVFLYLCRRFSHLKRSVIVLGMCFVSTTGVFFVTRSDISLHLSLSISHPALETR